MRTELALYAAGFLMPLVVMAFMRPVFRYALESGEGYAGANGSEHAVPGMAVMFGFFMVGMTAFTFFREHGFGTWDRIRATPTRPWEVLVGKLLPFLVVILAQQLTLFALGAALFGLELRGSVVALVLVAGALSFCFVAFAVAVVALARSVQEINVLQTVGTMVFAGLGGALAPVSLLPGPLEDLAPAVPSYWAMRGYRSVILDGGGLAEVALPAAVLLLFAAGLLAIAAVRFRFEESKPYWL
jgi:ABC-2 type transport system permease protein